MYGLTPSNLKASCKVLTDGNWRQLARGEHYNSFVVVREKCYVYTLFYSGGHVNMTGIKSWRAVPDAVHSLFEILEDNYARIKELKVDNILYKVNLGVKLDVRRIHKYVESVDYEGYICCSYNVDNFPGLHLKTGEGTAILFSSGKVLIHVWGSPVSIRPLLSLLSKIVRHVECQRDDV